MIWTPQSTASNQHVVAPPLDGSSRSLALQAVEPSAPGAGRPRPGPRGRVECVVSYEQ
jgi:hypothetical protein